MDYLDFLPELEGRLRLERVTGACQMALEEYRACMLHDEDLLLPKDSSDELRRRLSHGRDLALARARRISETLQKILAHFPMRALPPEYQRFHPDYMTRPPMEDKKIVTPNWPHDDVER